MNGSKSHPEKRPLVAPHIAALPKSGIRDFFDLVSTMKDVISLGIGEPDFVTPWNIRENALYSIERGSARRSAIISPPISRSITILRTNASSRSA